MIFSFDISAHVKNYKKHLMIALSAVFLAFGSLLYPQPANDPWIRVENSANQNLRIDVSTLKESQDNDIFVWCLETHRKPIRIDSVPGNIYKTKTYFLLNKNLMKYSILEVMYYDSVNTVLKDFNYRLRTNKPELRYNYSILTSSPLNSILNKSLEFLRSKNAKKP